MAVRIIVDIHPQNPNYEPAWNDAKGVIEVVLKALKKKKFIPEKIKNEEPDVRWLATSICSSSARIAFDISHTTFDIESAHLYGQDLPVIVVSMRRRTKAFPANEKQTRKANSTIRRYFNEYGIGSQPPFREDYRNKRSYSFLSTKFRDHNAWLGQFNDEIQVAKARKQWSISQSSAKSDTAPQLNSLPTPSSSNEAISPSASSWPTSSRPPPPSQ